jgi:hypothetical protein
LACQGDRLADSQPASLDHEELEDSAWLWTLTGLLDRERPCDAGCLDANEAEAVFRELLGAYAARIQ